ncbi:cation:proton antiporter [Ligaoa zhengdingensis]|uniref:cation:proton antiporter n=1 Tax=Ligaoa zhengdingensis TaxID=2763658 RepID=UPI0031B9D799
MELSIFFYLAILMAAGLLFGKLAKLVKLPNVTGYLVGGLLVGPSILGLIPADQVAAMSIVSDMALGFIAFSIGTEFKISYFKRVGFTPIVIAILEALFGVWFVLGGLLLAGFDLPFSLVLSAIAAATAPAATIMVIKQYKAKGPVTETLLSVVALDDAVALIAFGFAVTIAKSLTFSASGSVALSILEPFLEVVITVVVGGLLGLAFAFVIRFFKSSANRLCLAVAFVFATTAAAAMLDVSSLLMCMAMGAVLVNLSDSAVDVMKVTDQVTPPLFLLFFALSGAGLDISILPSIGLVGVIYVVLRVAGKMFGAWAGGAVMKAPKTVRRYLGPALLPQAGVAIGLTFVAQTVVPEFAATIRAVILCGTLIYELIGPMIVKISLTKAGEITPEK